MVKKFALYVWQGWSNDNASWCQVAVSQFTLFCAWLLLMFFLYGWMLLFL